MKEYKVGGKFNETLKNLNRVNTNIKANKEIKMKKKKMMMIIIIIITIIPPEDRRSMKAKLAEVLKKKWESKVWAVYKKYGQTTY